MIRNSNQLLKSFLRSLLPDASVVSITSTHTNTMFVPNVFMNYPSRRPCFLNKANAGEGSRWYLLCTALKGRGRPRGRRDAILPNLSGRIRVRLRGRWARHCSQSSYPFLAIQGNYLIN